MTISILSTTRLLQLIDAQISALALPPQEIVSRMGYAQSRYEQACQRLQQVLSSDSLGLADAHYDFKYDGKGFLVALCRVLDIAPAQYQPLLDEIEADVQQRASYRLRAKISFESGGASAISLMALNRFLYQGLPTDFYRMDDAAQRRIAREYTQAHHQRHADQLPYSATITGYEILRQQQGVERTVMTIPIAN